MNYLNTLISLEMLFFNLYTFIACSKKKAPIHLIWIVLILFTGLFIAGLLPISQRLPNIGSGNGLLVFTGFIYVIPLYFLHDQALRKTLLIMCSSWIYTMLVFSLSFRISGLLPDDWTPYSTLIIQTLIYGSSFSVFLKFVRETFIKILSLMENRAMNRLLAISFLWFFLIVVTNFNFVEGSNFSTEVIILFLILINAILTYKLFYSLVFLNRKTLTLEEKTRLDPLTKLKNREALYEDIRTKIAEDSPFYLLFIDLDNFKWVNDTQGHAVGDAYLIQFAKKVKEQLETVDSFYRLSGDEFIIVYDGQNVHRFCDHFNQLSFYESESGVEFQGLSMGVAHYPNDARRISNLLQQADENMYQIKKIKHRIGYPPLRVEA